MDFGSHVGAKMEPQTPLLEPRAPNRRKTIPSLGMVFRRSRYGFSSIEPRWPQDLLKTPQDLPRPSPRLIFLVILDPN